MSKKKKILIAIGTIVIIILIIIGIVVGNKKGGKKIPSQTNAINRPYNSASDSESEIEESSYKYDEQETLTSLFPRVKVVSRNETEPEGKVTETEELINVSDKNTENTQKE